MPVLLDSSRTLAPPPVEDVTRRDLLRGAGALGAGWVLAACAATPSDDPIAADSRRVEHPLGTAEVPTSPQRVVAVTGTVEVDALVAVGIVPVAAAELETGLGFGQQVADALEGTVMLGTRREIDIEAVAAQEPDLIIGTEGWLTDVYEQLSQVAPTVAVDDAAGWRDVTRQVADAVGRTERGEDVIAEVDERIDALAGRSGDAAEGLSYTLMASFIADGEYGLYHLPDDVDALLQRLGMRRTDEQLRLLAQESYAPISTEQVDLIDTDAIFLFAYSDDDSQAQVEATLADPLFSALPAAQADRVFVVDFDHWYFVTPQAVAQILDDLEQDVLPRLTGAT